MRAILKRIHLWISYAQHLQHISFIPTIVSILITKKIISLEVPILTKYSLHLDVQPSLAFIFGHTFILQTGKT